MKQIKSILRKALRIQNKEGHSTAVILLKNMLRSLTSVYPKEYWSCPEGYDRPLSEHLPIRQWGKPGNIHSLKVSIHTAWKFQDFSYIQILREINFRECKSSLTTGFAIFWALNFVD